jgi:hypothetical protein
MNVEESGQGRSVIETGFADRPGWARIGIGAASCVFVLALILSWAAQRRLDGWLDQLDTRTLEESSRVLEQLVTQQGKQLASTAALLSEDARVRAMVLTPNFDRATVIDLLTDLKVSSGASLVAILDSDGKVQAVVGAPELEQLDLGTSSLVRNALEKPSAQLWAFANEVGVLSASAVRLDNQVRALFMMGFELEDAVLQNIERNLGATAAVFVGDKIVASANWNPGIERALRSAAELPSGKYRVVADTFLATRTQLSDSPGADTVAWLVPRYRQAEAVALPRALSWLPAILVGLVLAIFIAVTMSQSRAAPTQRN